MFASLNACRGNNKSRRDDIESAFYVLIYLLNGQKLPWSDFQTRFKDANMQFSDFLRHRLKRYYSRELFTKIPENLQVCLKRVMCIKFNEEPPYDQILQCL